jgi:hypothetical protein
MSHMSQVQHQQRSDDGTTAYMHGTPVTPIKLYDPNDTTTHPGYHSVPTSTSGVEVPVVRYDGGPHGNTFANTQTGGPGANTLTSVQTQRPLGYNGLPTV